MAKELPSVDCSAQPFDLSFHPMKDNLLAVGLVDGTLEVHEFTDNQSDDEYDTIISSLSVHKRVVQSVVQDHKTRKASCRAVRFSHDGSKILTGGSDGGICVVDAERACTLSAPQGSILWQLPEAIDSHGIQVLHQLPPEAPTGALFVSGDEEGGVRLWDVRHAQKKPAVSWKKNTDYISGLDSSPDGKNLLASSADCTLSIFDLRKAQTPNETSIRRSDDQEDELLSVKIMKNGNKVVCGTQEGVLAVWSFGTWGDISDRFPGHPASIDALLKVDEDTLLTGSSDGILRVVQIHPDKLLGVLGDHDGYPIEKLQFNANRAVVGSVSHDSYIRLWDARILDEDYEDGSDVEDGKARLTKSAVASAIATRATNHSDDQWDDDTDESDSDSSSDKSAKNVQRAKRFKTDNEKFFEDL